MVEIGIMNLCILGKRIDKDPALFIGLNMKITKNVILHHKIADKKWKYINITNNISDVNRDINLL